MASAMTYQVTERGKSERKSTSEETDAFGTFAIQRNGRWCAILVFALLSACKYGPNPCPQKPLAKSEEITIEGVFGPGGVLEKRHPGYEFRPSQLAMAKLAEEAFEKRQHTVIEAGTGTGKTLAYLIPAIRSGRRVVVSTATKSLQEQLFQKDVPFLQKHFAPNLKAAMMKGRANFLCRQKVHQMDGQAALKGIDEVDWFTQIRDWSKLTETGRPQRADLPSGRRRALESHRRAQRSLHRPEVCGISTLLHHGDASARAGSGFNYRQSPSFFRRPRDSPGGFRFDLAGIFRRGLR